VIACWFFQALSIKIGRGPTIFSFFPFERLLKIFFNDFRWGIKNIKYVVIAWLVSSSKNGGKPAFFDANFQNVGIVSIFQLK
jgi:hypothetical protein